MPDASRAKACIGVIAGGNLYFVDTGIATFLLGLHASLGGCLSFEVITRRIESSARLRANNASSVLGVGLSKIWSSMSSILLSICSTIGM